VGRVGWGLRWNTVMYFSLHFYSLHSQTCFFVCKFKMSVHFMTPRLVTGDCISHGISTTRVSKVSSKAFITNVFTKFYGVLKFHFKQLCYLFSNQSVPLVIPDRNLTLICASCFSNERSVETTTA